MDSLETPYEVELEIDFIECEVCNKTIRGETLYKIHITTAGHMKKEQTLVYQGHAVRNCIVPDFEDIQDYLRYLNLDEPIIGLNQLEEVSHRHPNDLQPGPRYNCRLCDLEANLPNMVNHIIGRKHRQKYLEMKRPDLVTWNPAAPFSSTNSGKIIQAKAEVAERQNGRGTPKSARKSLAKTVGRSNISRVLPQQKNNVGQNSSRGLSSQSQEFTDYPGEYSHHSGNPLDGNPLDDPNMPPYHTNDGYMSADAERGAYPAIHDYHGDYRMNSEDMSRRNFPESGGTSRDAREEMTYGPTYHNEAPLHRKPSAGSDPLREFMDAERGRGPSAEAVESRNRAYPAHNPHGSTYAEDDPHSRAYQPEGSGLAVPGGGIQARTSIDYSHGKVPFDINSQLRQRPSPDDPYSNPRPDPHQRSYPGGEGQDRSYSEEDPYRPLYPGANQQRRSLDREPNRPGNANGAGRREPSGQDAKRPRLAEPMEIEQWQEGPAGDPNFREMSNIPEPFRRFLQGASEDQMKDGKRRKKSRFSDATKEEVERAKLTPGPPRPGQGPRTQDIHRPQRPGPYDQQGQYNTESFSEKIPESGNVFDLMKDIEIDDVEDADFLKSKLCNLLKEFQAKKLEKTSQKNEGPAGMSAGYHGMDNDQRAPPPGQHDRNIRESPQGQRAHPPGQHDRNIGEGHQGQWASPPGQHDRNIRESPQGQRAHPPGQHDRNIREGPQGQWASPPGQHDRNIREGPQGKWAPPPGQHDRNFREPQDRRFDNQRRQSQEARRPQRDRDERGQLHDDGSHGHHPSGQPQDSASSRSRYEEVFGGAGQGQPPYAVQEQPPLYPERFNDPRNPHHPSGNREYFDHFPPANAFHGGEQGYGSHRRPNSSLDKITSTLLELVARK